jgi:hypothetical protein
LEVPFVQCLIGLDHDESVSALHIFKGMKI